MATLDRFITLMFDKQGSAIRLETDKPVIIEIDGNQKPATREPLAGPKLMALIKEVMPEGMHAQLDGGDGRLVFGYIGDGHRVDIETTRSGTSLSAVLSPAKPRRSTAAVSRPAEALLMARK